MKEKIDGMLATITAEVESFKEDAMKQFDKNNAAAGKRARQTGQELIRLLKEFRATSLAFKVEK